MTAPTQEATSSFCIHLKPRNECDNAVCRSKGSPAEATYSPGAVEAARKIFQGTDDVIHATDIPLMAKIIDRETNLPALLESHKQLVELVSAALKTGLNFGNRERCNCAGCQTLKTTLIEALAKAKEIQP